METSKTISNEDLECIVCTEIPITVHETGWCGTIVCEECGPKLKTCPNRCLADNAKLVLNLNKFIQRMINHIKVACPYCKSEFARSELADHKEDCPENKLKPVIINPALHPCCLYKTKKTNDWFWDGLKIIKHGCGKSGLQKEVTKMGESWYCSRWDSDFCESWIQLYADNSDADDLKQFLKDGQMHLSHPHPLKMYFGVNLPEQARLNWYGKYKQNGCSSGGKEVLRYLVCYDCKLVLWETWFLDNSDEYIVTNPSKLHKHMMHLQAIPSIYTWGWDVKTPIWIKKDHAGNKNCRISYRCDVWDYDTWIECLKELTK